MKSAAENDELGQSKTCINTFVKKNPLLFINTIIDLVLCNG